jgi:hypothetical protein
MTNGGGGACGMVLRWCLARCGQCFTMSQDSRRQAGWGGMLSVLVLWTPRFDAVLEFLEVVLAADEAGGVWASCCCDVCSLLASAPDTTAGFPGGSITQSAPCSHAVNQ